MNPWSAIAIGLLVPLGLALSLLLVAWPVASIFALWHETPAEQRDGMRLLPKAVKGGLVRWMAVLWWFSPRIGLELLKLTGNAKLIAAGWTVTAAWLPLTFFAVAAYPVIWAARVLHYPPSRTGATLRRLARFSLPFSVAGIVAYGWLACGYVSLVVHAGPRR